MVAGRQDSALVHAQIAAADSGMRPFVGPIYLQIGLQALRDSNYAVAESLLVQGKEWSTGRARVTAAFGLGIAQIQLGVRIDRDAEANRDCDLARRSTGLFTSAEQNIIEGVAINREQANQLLSQVIPAYKQRADAMTRNYCR
jgi:hypothetical protein